MKAFRAAYFREAARLRWCLHQTYLDHRFADAGGRIIYLMDANIVRFFVNPERDRRLAVSFRSIDKEEIDPGTALVTAEYLFSRQLPGQRATPAFIAPAHGDDMQEIISAMQDGSHGEFDVSGPHQQYEPLKSETELRQERAQLEQLVADVRAKKLQRSVAIERLRRIVPDLAHHLVAGGYQEANQLLRLFNEDLLRPLSLHTHVTRDVLNAARDPQTLKWQDRLRNEQVARDQWWQAERRRSERDPSRRRRDSERAQRRRERDAEVLVQTMRLNENARSANELRYVLVTADQALIDAYARWFWEQPSTDRNIDDFVLRDLMQYSPLLHTGEMPNGDSSSDIVASARLALDSLFLSHCDLREGYPAKLLYHRLRPLLASSNDDPFAASLSAIDLGDATLRKLHTTARYWAQSFRDEVVLNADLIQRRLTTEFEHVAALLRQDEDLVAALHRAQREVMDKVIGVHVAVTARGTLRHLAAGLDEKNVTERRSPLIFHPERFRGLLQGERLEAVLNKLASRDPQAWRQVEERMANAAPDDRLLLAACIAHRLHEWETARRYVELILNELPQPARIDARTRDLLYLRAAITRMDFASPEKVRTSFDSLKDVLRACQAESDQFGIARALCELCAFVLSAVMRSRLSPMPPRMLSDEAEFDEATTVASLADELLQAIKNTGTGSAELTASTDANLLRAYVYVTVLTGASNGQHSFKAVADYVLTHCETELNSMTTDAQRGQALAVLSGAHRLSLASAVSNIREFCDRTEDGRSALENTELRWLTQSLSQLEHAKVSVAPTV